MHEAVVTAEAADSVAWKWGDCRVLHGYVRSRLGHDEQFSSIADLVPDGKGSFLVMEVSSWTRPVPGRRNPPCARHFLPTRFASPLARNATAVRVVCSSFQSRMGSA